MFKHTTESNGYINLLLLLTNIYLRLWSFKITFYYTISMFQIALRWKKYRFTRILELSNVNCFFS